MKCIIVLILFLTIPSVCLSRSNIEALKVEYTKCMGETTDRIMKGDRLFELKDIKESPRMVIRKAHSECYDVATQIEVTLTEIGYDDPDTHKKFFEWMNRYHKEDIIKYIKGEQ